MNQEMMAMYKTYKVNPMGGCLPMIIQIPFFFALYKVLMSAIELRHAPFMLWINDLSAPDRLMVGFDIPYIHGIPVLTLLMGASMYLQQKMTPTTADPTQAKIMQFLPLFSPSCLLILLPDWYCTGSSTTCSPFFSSSLSIGRLRHRPSNNRIIFLWQKERTFTEKR